MNNNRYLSQHIQELALQKNKMAFIAGPRQVGKTTMSRHIGEEYKGFEYFNWDDKGFRKKWTLDPATVVSPNFVGKDFVLIFDEIHKAKLWKRDIKGFYDNFKTQFKILVTGSAKLNVFQKGGDSLLGRYFLFRLHPLSVAELLNRESPSPEICLNTIFAQPDTNSQAQEFFEKLLKFGGFPEPFFEGSERFLNLWHQGRTEKIIREDLRDLSRIPELSQIEMLAALLPEKVGSTLSVENLRKDLEVSFNTVKRWLGLLEKLYYFYTVRPYSKSIVRSIRKEPKVFMWDWSEVESASARLENIIASHLLKACDFWTDTGYGIHELYYLRNKQKEEVDFLMTHKSKPFLSVEVKLSEEEIDKNFLTFCRQLNLKRHVQVVGNSEIYKRKHIDGVDVIVIGASRFLQCLV